MARNYIIVTQIILNHKYIIITDLMLSFTFQSNVTAESAELFVNCLEAMVETCLPGEDGEMELVQYPSMLSVSSNMNPSSSLSSLNLGSSTDRGKFSFVCIYWRENPVNLITHKMRFHTFIVFFIVLHLKEWIVYNHKQVCFSYTYISFWRG